MGNRPSAARTRRAAFSADRGVGVPPACSSARSSGSHQRRYGANSSAIFTASPNGATSSFATRPSATIRPRSAVPEMANAAASNSATEPWAIRLRVAARTRRRSEGVQFFRRVKNRMLGHSNQPGRCRGSALAAYDAARPASRSSARPRRVSRCLRVNQSRRECTR